MVDKFIGDEVMVIFPRNECKLPPFKAAMYTARAMLERDPYAFDPKIGIASGSFAVALVGTQEMANVSAMGHTVNLAARCVGSTKGPHTVRIATEEIATVKEVFGEEKVWKVSSPELFEPKNMATVHVVDVSRKTIWIPNFDYLQDVRQNVKFARTKGTIQDDG
jgi:class 3 adenylate cyclase